MAAPPPWAAVPRMQRARPGRLATSSRAGPPGPLLPAPRRGMIDLSRRPAQGPDLSDLPTGTVTFLFTDIEGSTRLWEQHPEAMRRALAWHDALLREVIHRCGGHVFKTMGDSFHAAFPSANEALTAALDAQRGFEG